MTLNPRFVLGALDLTEWPFAVEFGTDLGNPENASDLIASLLQDGEVVSSTRSGNRALAVPIMIADSDLLALAEAEARLYLEADKRRNTLAVDPGDGIAPVTVFDSFRAQVTFRRDDDEELSGVRRYLLTIPALPFGRSEADVVEVATLATGGADTQIDACDATTGWTVAGGTLATDATYKAEGSASLRSTPNSGAFVPVSGGSQYEVTTDVTFTKAGLSVNLSTTPFVSVKVFTRYSAYVNVTCLVDGLAAKFVTAQQVSADWTTYTFYSTDAAVSSLAFRVVSTGVFPADPTLANTWLGPSAPSWEPRIDDVRRSGFSPAASTNGKERTLEIAVSGSARTQGSLAIEHATDYLGEVLVYTSPLLSATGYTPDLERWTVSYSAISTSAGYLSGRSYTLNAGTPWRMEVPATAIPEGGYELLAFVDAHSGDKVLTVDVSLVVGSTVVATTQVVSPPLEVTPLLGAGAAWRSLGWVMLPPSTVAAGSTAVVRFDVKDPTSGTTTAKVSELLILSTEDDAAVTLVNCGDSNSTPMVGAANNRLWLVAPSLNVDVPLVLSGTAADQSDAYGLPDSAVTALGAHQFKPSSVLLYVATSHAQNPKITYRHPPRHFGHAT